METCCDLSLKDAQNFRRISVKRQEEPMAITVMYPNMLSLCVTLFLIGQMRSIDVDQVRNDLQIGGQNICKYCWACVYAEHCDWACFFPVSEYCDFCVYSFHCYTTCPYLCVARTEAKTKEGPRESSAATGGDSSTHGASEDEPVTAIELTTPTIEMITENGDTGGRVKHENSEAKGFSANVSTKQESEDFETSKSHGNAGVLYPDTVIAGSKTTALESLDNSKNGGYNKDDLQSSGDGEDSVLHTIHSTEAGDITSSGDEKETVKALEAGANYTGNINGVDA